MTSIADRWALHPEHLWLRGHQPEQPVRFDPDSGLWNVYGHAEAVQVLSDPKTFSSDVARRFAAEEIDEKYLDGNLVQADPPDHRRLRALVGQAFTPRTVAGLEPRIVELTHQLLDAVDGAESFDLVADLAYPLPVTVIAELLGVPSSDHPLFKGWVDRMFDYDKQFFLTDENGERQRMIQERLALADQMRQYLIGHAAERRTKPREDLLTRLVEVELDGERLTVDQVANFANLLLVAGHITTTMLLGNTVLALDAHPEQAAAVRADRRLVPTAIEESLRLLSPFSLLYRATNTEAELAGHRIPADQGVAVWLGAANRDERQFERPEVFDPARDPNPHLGFGRGIHFCLGAPLARLEGRLALDILLDRFPVLRTDPDNPPTFMHSPETTGVRTLPLRL